MTHDGRGAARQLLHYGTRSLPSFGPCRLVVKPLGACIRDLCCIRHNHPGCSRNKSITQLTMVLVIRTEQNRHRRARRLGETLTAASWSDTAANESYCASLI